MKHIILLGGSGSIGRQTLDILAAYSNKFKLVGISLGDRDIDYNLDVIESFQPEIVCLRTNKDLETYRSSYPEVTYCVGDKGLLELASYPIKGVLINALMGSVGLKPTIEAIKSGKNIALANKETLVMAGDLINELVKTHKVKLLPIDSEHNALLQAMLCESRKDVLSMLITASGGSFRDLTRKQLEHVTKEDALKHPNWMMGEKITIDSATMMNKGLEVIEAHHLFHIDYDKIKTVIHRESIIHGMVTYVDQSTKAILGYPDMRMPILYALSYPRHYKLDVKPLNFDTIGALTFEKMDFDRYPLLRLAYEVGVKGGLFPVVMNAANEKAVKLFLDGKISFLQIESLVYEAVNAFHTTIEKPTLEDILETNQKIYESVGI
ncbi:MAG: 1-deoxy-D-xylulose-5-phosphate reductoisomerase [Acholeplasma sp.]|nr:1-deoxy-D-xylulose-5-phosphate reductoisomerase [Acholeplasma sp.]